MFKFIHAADIHLDSPLRGLERYDGAPADHIRGATRTATERLVNLALTDHVEFVLIAGDLYDGDWRDFNTGLYLSAQMSRLRTAGIRVFIVAGNHDAASQITRSLRLPDNVHVFSSDKPETKLLDDLAVAVHGQSYATRAITSNLAINYPSPIAHFFNIGLLHTCVGGYEGFEPYAPCAIDDLIGKHYDYWALGHVHTRLVLREQNPCILFPGNLQGRNIRESGNKGCAVVSVDSDGRVTCEHRPLDVVRWTVLKIDASSALSGEDVLNDFRDSLQAALETSDDRFVAARVEVTGSTEAHDELVRDSERWTNEIRNVATDMSSGRAWIEKICLDTMPAVNEEVLKKAEGPVAELLRYFDVVHGSAEELKLLAEELAPLRGSLPSSIVNTEEILDLKDIGKLRTLLEKAKRLLLVRLDESRINEAAKS